jgi:hypothetical protein
MGEKSNPGIELKPSIELSRSCPIKCYVPTTYYDDNSEILINFT